MSMNKRQDQKKKTTRGGVRKNSGRKAIDPAQKKEPFILYLSKNEIDKCGGEDEFKAYIYSLVKQKNPLSGVGVAGIA